MPEGRHRLHLTIVTMLAIVCAASFSPLVTAKKVELPPEPAPEHAFVSETSSAPMPHRFPIGSSFKQPSRRQALRSIGSSSADICPKKNQSWFKWGFPRTELRSTG